MSQRGDLSFQSIRTQKSIRDRDQKTKPKISFTSHPSQEKNREKSIMNEKKAIRQCQSSSNHSMMNRSLTKEKISLKQKKNENPKRKVEENNRPPLPNKIPSSYKNIPREQSIINGLTNLISQQENVMQTKQISSSSSRNRSMSGYQNKSIHALSIKKDSKKVIENIKVVSKKKSSQQYANRSKKSSSSYQNLNSSPVKKNEEVRKNEETLNQNSSQIRSDGKVAIKLVLVGDGSVGKTSMLYSYTKDEFPDDYIPTIFDNYVAEVKHGQTNVKLWLWDTAGQEQYGSLRNVSYKKADVFLICFSMIDQISFKNAVQKWFPEVQKNNPKSMKILVGTKSDLHTEYSMIPEKMNKAISLHKIKKECALIKCDFYACSSLDQKGLNEAFTEAITRVLKKVENKKKQKEDECRLI